MALPTAKLVLVIEDDLDILDSLVELLQEEGYRVLRARDGLEGLEVLRNATELPSLVLLDLMMPRKDGIAFRGEQIQDPRLAAIPVILMSADGQIESKQLKAGLTHHLKKPLDVEDFLSMVGRLA